MHGLQEEEFPLCEGQMNSKSQAIPGRSVQRAQHTARDVTVSPWRGTLEAAQALQSSSPCSREHFVTSGYKHLEIIKNQQRRLSVLIK